MRRAVVLARVSRDEGQTTASQIDALCAAAGRLGVEVVGKVAEVCGAWDEPAAAKVRALVFAELDRTRADGLMVWSLDRLTRGGVESAFRCLRELEVHRGIGFWSLQEPFLSTARADPQTRELLLALLAWVAKWESQRRSERLRARVQSKRAASAKLGRRAVWGRGHLPTPRELATARLLRAAGATYRAIAERLKVPLGTVHRACSNPGAAGAGRAPVERRRRSTAPGGTRRKGNA